MKGSISTASAVDLIPETPFYIPATGSSTRPRRTIKHGDTFAIFDSHGDIGASGGGPDGIFHGGTRFLSVFELSINGMQPLVLGSNVRDDNSILNIDLTNPDIFADGHLVLHKDMLHILRTVFLWQGVAHVRLGLWNHGSTPVQVNLGLKYGSDFADVFEVRGMVRAKRGSATAIVLGQRTVALSYQGLDAQTRRTALTFDPAPAMITPTKATYSLTLRPAERTSLFVSIACGSNDDIRPAPFFRSMISAFRERRALTQDATTVEASNEIFNRVLCRSMSDLYMLLTPTPEGPYPYAGTPWYSTTFGRDGLITAMQTLWCDPSIARGVLSRLAAFQATAEDPMADAEPGKILHEMRSGEMAALREIPFGLYYGSVDSTPLFVMLVGMYAERTGDMKTVSELWPHVEAALAWMDQMGDIDGDGFVEYRRATEEGLANQGWKDSQDAVFHADGSLAKGPIALAEVQGYVFEAKRLAARCARRLGQDALAKTLDADARLLAERFEAAFWCPEIESYAIALDGQKRQCAVRSSNAGQVLFTGIANRTRALAVARDLMRPHFFSGWGIRTIAHGEPRYNPMSYHNGSVWPHDNSIIALGFARYGFVQGIERIFQGMFDAATYMDLQRLPELFCGFRRGRMQGPTLYPVACSPQAWAAATPVALLQASLGLAFDPWKCEIQLHNPGLPSFLDHVVLRNLRLGAASVDLCIRRHGQSVSVEVAKRRGSIHVATIAS